MKSTYGDRLRPELSRAHTAEFGKGFSYANLRNFRQFYLTYPQMEICYTLCSKLTWSHKRLIMREEKADDYSKKYEAELISPAEAAKWTRGASNAGYHNLGCAKTFALIGKAFAEANLEMMKGR